MFFQVDLCFWVDVLVSLIGLGLALKKASPKSLFSVFEEPLLGG
jgi:hypothetical protein